MMAADQEYSQATARSLQNVDESLINYELLETLVSHVVSSQQATSSEANAILIFLPGVPEISRLVRALQVCKALWPRYRRMCRSDACSWSALGWPNPVWRHL